MNNQQNKKGGVKIQELSTPGCSHCAAAKEILENEIKPNFPDVEIEYIDMLSDEGQKMVQEYGVMSSPGIIVNGELFSVGGLDKDKLVDKIKELS
ncbi:MAG: glutaredoxin family protein [Candidatus Paceibacteria bacterium]